LPAHDLATEALAGVVSVNLGSDGEPAMPHMPTADMAASMLAFSGVLMALLRRQMTGRGDFVDVAMHDAVLAWTANVLGDVFSKRQAPQVKDERTWGGAAFYNIYRTRDGRHVVLGAQEIKFARNLLREFGRLDLLELCERGWGAHQRPVTEFLRAQFLTKTSAEWQTWFRGKDISFAPVNNLREAFDDPQVAARDMRLVDEQGHEHIGIPIKFADEPGRVDFRLPHIGEHNVELLASLGYSSAEIAALRPAASHSAG
jgi:crotonobetainyl-CoA:carnitine CoA-transferase CaiB-like acyl-CoA transferase